MKYFEYIFIYRFSCAVGFRLIYLLVKVDTPNRLFTHSSAKRKVNIIIPLTIARFVYDVYRHHCSVFQYFPYMNKYYIINAQIKLWTLSMWHIMSLMRCIILLNNIKWKMYTQNRTQKCECISYSMLSTHRSILFYIELVVCWLAPIRSLTISHSILSFYLFCFMRHMRDFDAVFNKHYRVCVCVYELKSASLSIVAIHPLTKYPLATMVCALTCKYIQLDLIIDFDDVEQKRGRCANIHWKLPNWYNMY